MRLAVVSPSLVDRRGTEVHITSICSSLSEKGHQVDCVSGGFGAVAQELSEKIQRTVIPSLDYSNSKFTNPAMSSIGLVAHFIKSKPDLVISHGGPLTVGPVRMAAKVCGLPTVHTMHWNSYSDETSLKSMALSSMEWGTSKLSDSYLITVSESDRSLAVDKGLMVGDRCFAVHNGIENIEKRERGVGVGRILMVGAFSEPKNQMCLIRAFSKIAAPTATLDFVGGGDTLMHRSLANALGVAGRVNFHGAQNDVQKYLDQSDVFVLSSDSECFPLTILEAMRSSLPVLASAVGGVAEAVQHGETGFLLKPRDEADITEKLDRMLLNAGMSKSMGEQGRARFEQNFTADRMLSKTLDVYDHIIDRHKVHVPRVFMG